MENKFIVLKEKPKGVRRIFRENGIRTFPGDFLCINYTLPGLPNHVGDPYTSFMAMFRKIGTAEMSWMIVASA